MTGDLSPSQKKRRRRNRRRSAGQGEGVAAAPNVQAMIDAAVQAALASVGMLKVEAVAQDDWREHGQSVTVDDDKAEALSIAQEQASRAARAQDFEARFGALIGEIFPARDLPVLNWMTSGTSTPVGAMCVQILRAAVARERPGYREFMGGGGNSSRNIDVLAEKLPRGK